jgi:teichuronic acid biosynthesis glycosyltransferase TuaC
MKIVLFDYVFDQEKPGASGLSDVVWELAQGLTDLGEEVHIVGPYPEGTAGPANVVIHSFSLPPINYRNVVGHLLIINKGWQVIRREIPDADIVHAPEYLSTAYFCLRTRVPVILTTPGNIYERIHSGSNPFDWSMTLVLKVAARISARRCAGINAISSDMQAWWGKSGAAPAKIRVFPYGVDNAFHPIEGSRERLAWSSGKRHLLFVGRLSKEKGVDLLIHAFGQLVHQISDLELHIVGDGKERKAYEALAQQVNGAAITFHGWIDKYELPVYYSASDILVVPSRTEPLGRIVLEALACKVLVVGAQIGGIPDLVADERTGLLFQPGDASDLRRKLEQALTSPDAEQWSAAGYEQARENLNWRAIAARIRDEMYRPNLAKLETD